MALRKWSSFMPTILFMSNRNMVMIGKGTKYNYFDQVKFEKFSKLGKILAGYFYTKIAFVLAIIHVSTLYGQFEFLIFFILKHS